MRSVVDRNVVMRRIPVLTELLQLILRLQQLWQGTVTGNSILARCTTLMHLRKPRNLHLCNSNNRLLTAVRPATVSIRFFAALQCIALFD
jgi:hypothetical protein